MAKNHSRRPDRRLQLIALAMAMVVVRNFIMANSVVNQKEIGTYSSTNDGGKNVEAREPVQLRLPTPIFVIGYPKVGTSSIHAMFMCSGVKSSHYCCCGSNRTHTDCHGGGGDGTGRTFSACMRANKKANRPILEGCGDYDVYAQMDAEFGNSMHLPQHFDLESLHQYAPNATFILNLRPSKDWINSVTHWYGLGGRFLRLFKVDLRTVERNRALEEIFDNHTWTIRNFVRLHPSHHLVEVDISSSAAGETLSEAFGIPKSCWGLHNKNKRVTGVQE